ncbi:MAG: DUF2634 domain-containing protein [Raoultibacter sp.]
MPDTLYPVFDTPAADPTLAVVQRYKPSPMFDFDTGDFVRDGANRVVMCDGAAAYKLWCQKILKTQKGACLAYIDVGIDREQATAQPTRQAAQSAFERTITQALLMHPCTQRVKDFSFFWTADTLKITFTVKARDIAAFTVSLDVVT